MKKLFITAAIATMFSVSAFADGTKKTDAKVSVSYSVLNQFDADFGDAKDVNWSVDRNFQKADFNLNNVKMTAFYNLRGEFVALTQDINVKAIPAKTQAEINAKYNGYVVNEVILVQNNTDLNTDVEESAYFVDLKNDTKEVLVKITPEAHIEFFKQVK